MLTTAIMSIHVWKMLLRKQLFEHNGNRATHQMTSKRKAWWV